MRLSIAKLLRGLRGRATGRRPGAWKPFLLAFWPFILGAALVVFGSTLMLLHGMNRQARLLKRILERERAAPAETSVSSNGPVLVPAGASAFHRPGCRLVEGKSARRLKLETAKRKGLAPCPLCDPAVRT